MRRASSDDAPDAVDETSASRSRASGGSGPATAKMSERFTPRAHDLDPAGVFTDVYPGETIAHARGSATRRNEYAGVRVPGEGGAGHLDLRRGISRREWRVETIEDQSKDVARWQLEFTKMRRRAEAAEEDNTRLKATHDEMRRKFEREHHARAALETRLRDIFAKPVVRDALASHPRGVTRRDDPHGAGNVLRPGEDVDGSEAAMMVFKALEDRISRDRDALEAANAREVRLATMLRHSETQKLAAYAEAEKSSRELEAHVAKLRVDRAVAKGLEEDLSAGKSAAEALRITTEKLSALELEAEALRENERSREAHLNAAVKAAVKKALDESVSEAKLEAARLGEALAKVRTQYGEQDWAHAKETERTKAGFERALATVLADRENLQRELKHARRDGRRADVERARVADEAAAVVEKAVAQREWALEVLDRAVDAEEEFARHLHYELYRASLLAMPETARVDDAETGGAAIAQGLHEVCARARTEWEREVVELRGDLAGLRRDVAAAGVAIDASRTCGIARGWAAAVDTVERAAATADGAAWAAMKRLAEAVRAASAAADAEARRGAAAAGLREYLRGYDEGTFDPSKYAMDARGVTNGATIEPPPQAPPPAPPPQRREERDTGDTGESTSTPAGTRRNIPEKTIEPPPGPEERVGFEAAIWRERARQKAAGRAAEREAERRAREAESAVKGAVAVGGPKPAPLSPVVDNGAGLNPPATDSTHTPAVAPKPTGSARKPAPRTLASIVGTANVGTAKTAKTVERFGAFQSSPYAPSKSAAKEIASLARNLRF